LNPLSSKIDLKKASVGDFFFHFYILGIVLISQCGYFFVK